MLSVLCTVVALTADETARPYSSLKWPSPAPSAERSSIAFPPASGKIKLAIDSAKYRSSSQGPIMKDELASGRPVNVEDLREIDEVIDRVTKTFGWDAVIPQYSGKRSWAWTQWGGTIIERLWKNTLLSALTPILLILGIHCIDSKAVWFGVPDDKNALIAPLVAVSHGWNYLLTLTTFVTTFFVGHSHSFWRNCYHLSRVVQGRMNDLGLLCASHAARTSAGELTPEAEQFLKDLGREIRLMHIFFWSDVCYRRSLEFGASIRVLLSMPALDRLHERGLLNKREHATLLAADVPPSRWYMIVIEWFTARIGAAYRDGVLVGGSGFEQMVLYKCCELRGACMGIPDELSARMPSAYVHFTHLLVDALLFVAPFALYPKLGAFAAVLNGFLALFYRGLLELSKSFLDPFGNRRVSAGGLSTDIGIATLIGETNAGSLIWPLGAVRVPFGPDPSTRGAAPPGAGMSGPGAPETVVGAAFRTL